MKIISWNVNGILACRTKGLLKFLDSTKPDIMCCQEIKTKCPLSTPGYLQYWNPSNIPGYSGTLALVKEGREPLSYHYGMGIDKFDLEGRLISLEYKSYYVVTVYVPSIHSHNTPGRANYRLEWDAALRKYISKLDKPVLLCGDFNATAAFIDSYPENQKNEPDNPLFQSESRDSIQQLISIGFVDAFRALYPDKEGSYTWWGPKNNDRNMNRGSRLDYFFLSKDLLYSLQNVKHHNQIYGSDHCPISLIFNPILPKVDMQDADLAIMWRAIDWGKMRRELISIQTELAMAAYERNWNLVEDLQDRIINSWAAKVLAVRRVADANTAVGVDGIRWTTDLEKAKAACSLTVRNYNPLPNRYVEIEERGKKRPLLIATARDRAMQTLLSFALKPVAESTADNMSFAAREGRSILDACAYLESHLRDKSVKCVVIIDGESFYGSILHDWLMKHIPIKQSLLRKVLKSGVIKNGVIFSTDRSISLASPLSCILGNMALDGLQTHIYDRLYPQGHDKYNNGSIVRFMDDIAITASSKGYAELIMQIVTEFLAERGVRPNPEKSYIVSVSKGFDFLGRHYQRRGEVLSITPSEATIKRIEGELDHLILEHKGTIRSLIQAVNEKLTRWSRHHRIEDSYMMFRHIDAKVTGLFVKRMCAKRPRWSHKAILNHFFVTIGGRYVFVLPTDHTVRVIQLSPLEIKKHKPCKADFNPFLDQDYQAGLQHQREIQKANGRFRGVWNRQNGRCAYCGQRMLADQEVEVVEQVVGYGWKPQNLIYIHRNCAYDTVSGIDEILGEPLNFFEMLEEFTEDGPDGESPYMELTDFFRKNNQTTISLKFQEIEAILGDRLPWEAYFYDSFWYADVETPDTVWKNEGFPTDTLSLSEKYYNISDSWTSQGYSIKALHRETNCVVFRKTEKGLSNIILPKALTSHMLPNDLVYKFYKLASAFVDENGL